MSHGLLFNVNYTYSHAIDNGSTWHSGATTANGAAAGEGYTTDQTLPGLDRGNSLFDIRQRLVFNYVWELPGKNLHGVMGAALGGWSYNGIWSFQSGAHWEPYRSTAANLSVIGARPGARLLTSTRELCRTGVATTTSTTVATTVRIRHCPATRLAAEQWTEWVGRSSGGFNTSHRRAWDAPATWAATRLWDRALFIADMTLAKVFKFTERVNMKFEAAGFQRLQPGELPPGNQRRRRSQHDHQTAIFGTGCRHPECPQPPIGIEVELLTAAEV